MPCGVYLEAEREDNIVNIKDNTHYRRTEQGKVVWECCRGRLQF